MKTKNFILLALLLVAGIIVGGLIASATKNITWLAWLGYAKSFGLDVAHPLRLDLSVLRLCFGFELSISIAQVLCLIAAALLYRRLR